MNTALFITGFFAVMSYGLDLLTNGEFVRFILSLFA